MSPETDIAKYNEMIDYLLCKDLKDLLGEFDLAILGLKKALVQRAKELLAKKDEKVYKKIEELYKTRYKLKTGESPKVDDKNEANKENEKTPTPVDLPNNSNSNKISQVESGKPAERIITSSRTNILSGINEIQRVLRLANINDKNTNDQNNNRNFSDVPRFLTINNASSTVSNQPVITTIVTRSRTNSTTTTVPTTSTTNSTTITVPTTSTTTTTTCQNNPQLVPLTTTGTDNNIRSITTNIHSNLEAITAKFRNMVGYKYCCDLEETTMIIRRNSSNDLCYKSVICLNKLKSDEVDFTKRYHVDRNLLIDLFRHKKYEIHLRIGFDEHNVYIPSQFKINLDHRPFHFSKYENICSINITPFFTRLYKTFNPIYFEIGEIDRQRTYFCGIYAFRRLNGSDIYNTNLPSFAPGQSIKLNNKPQPVNKLEIVKTKCTLDVEYTIRMIKEKLKPADSDFEIETDFIKFSLICPLTKTRIKIPSRGRSCKHVQCFDLESYILLNEKCEKWLCPICDMCVVYTNLCVDNFFKDIIENVKDCDEVKIESDGKWSRVNEDESNTETIDSLNCTIDLENYDGLQMSKAKSNESCIILD